MTITPMGADPSDPLRPHAHEPNPAPPDANSTFTLHCSPAGGRATTWIFNLAALHALPRLTVTNCLVVSTGHGSSGPFAYGGTELLALVDRFCGQRWQSVAVQSADGFGVRFTAAELRAANPKRPPLLVYAVDGEPLGRAAGLVRLIVPDDQEDALRQVKWVRELRVEGAGR